MKLFFTQCKVGSTENLNVNNHFLIFGFWVPENASFKGPILKKIQGAAPPLSVVPDKEAGKVLLTHLMRIRLMLLKMLRIKNW